MKNFVFFIIGLIVQSTGYAQIIKNVEDVSPFYEELAAIKKGDQWAFIDRKGVQVIDFRDDLVSDRHEIGIVSDIFPAFSDGRCLIKRLVDEEYYFGYIDKAGNEIIAPKYVNASNFKSGFAIVIEVEKKTVGYNKVLGKNVVSNTLKEYIIDNNGKKIKSLDNARNYIKTNDPPPFYSKIIAPHLVAVQTTDEPKYNIYTF